jgi:hypothetical protein
MAVQAELARKLDVTFVGRCPDAKTIIKAVKDGEDIGTKSLKHVEGCSWTVTLAKFSTTQSYFSFRLSDGRRTECYRPYAEKVSPDAWIAKLDVYCCSNEAGKEVTVKPDPEMDVSYLRQLTGKVQGSPPGMAVPYIEEGTLDPEKPVIDHVQFRIEKIHLQLGTEPPEPDAMGLWVNDLPLAVKKGYEQLKPDGVVYRLIVQRVEAGDLSMNAIELDVVKLIDVKLEKLEVWVK